MLDVLAILIFSLSFIYLLDDVVQVLSIDGLLEDIVFYTFLVGPFFVLPLSLLFKVKLKIKRFSLYVVLSSLQMLLIALFGYILLNSQV
jgi:hypothetical protein